MTEDPTRRALERVQRRAAGGAQAPAAHPPHLRPIPGGRADGRPAPPAPTVRVTLTASENAHLFPMLLTLLKNAWAAWVRTPYDAHEIVCMCLAFITGQNPDHLLGEVVENPVTVISDAAWDGMGPDERGKVRIQRLRPRPPASAPKWVQGDADKIKVTNADAATLRVTMSETMHAQLQAFGSYTLKLYAELGILNEPGRENEAKANALAFVLGVDPETFAMPEVVEQPLGVVPDRAWWGLPTDEARDLLKVQRIREPGATYGPEAVRAAPPPSTVEVEAAALANYAGPLEGAPEDRLDVYMRERAARLRAEAQTATPARAPDDAPLPSERGADPA